MQQLCCIRCIFDVFDEEQGEDSKIGRYDIRALVELMAL